jgi:tetratricopeptide (TPR) repeat protein
LAATLQQNDLAEYAGPCYLQAERLDPINVQWFYLHGLLVARSDADAAEPLLRRAAELAARGETAPQLAFAERLLAKGEYAEAETLLTDVARKDPEDVRLHYDAGLLCLARDELRPAADHFQHASRSPACRKKAHAQLAIACRRLGDVSAAAAAEAEAAKPPDDAPWPDLYVEEAARLRAASLQKADSVDVRMRQGRHDEVAEITGEAADVAGDGRNLVFLGMAALRLRDFDKAERAFRQILDRDADHVGANYGFGWLCFYQADELRTHGSPAADVQAKYAEADGYALRTLRNKPDHFPALVLHGLCLRLLDLREESLDAFRRAVRCRPDQAEGHLRLGEELALAGRKDDAAAELRQAIDLGDNDKFAAAARLQLDRLNQPRP